MLEVEQGTGMARLATVAQSQISIQPQLALPHSVPVVRIGFEAVSII